MFIISSAPSHLLGEGERARVERVGELLVVLGDHAGAGAAGAVELDQLDVEQRRDLGHRAVQLRCEAAAHAAGPVGDLHGLVLPSVLVCGASAPCRAGRRSLGRRALGDRRARLAARARLVLVVAGDVQVQLVALLAALDLLVDRLHALQVAASGSCGGFSAPIGVDLAAHQRLHDRPAASSAALCRRPGANLPNHELPP